MDTTAMGLFDGVDEWGFDLSDDTESDGWSEAVGLEGPHALLPGDGPERAASGMSVGSACGLATVLPDASLGQTAESLPWWQRGRDVFDGPPEDALDGSPNQGGGRVSRPPQNPTATSNSRSPRGAPADSGETSLHKRIGASRQEARTKTRRDALRPGVEVLVRRKGLDGSLDGEIHVLEKLPGTVMDPCACACHWDPTAGVDDGQAQGDLWKKTGPACGCSRGESSAACAIYRRAKNKPEKLAPIMPPHGPARPSTATDSCSCSCHGPRGTHWAWEPRARFEAAPCRCKVVRDKAAPGYGVGCPGNPKADPFQEGMVYHAMERLPCSCTTASADACADARFQPRIVGTKVDSLYLSFHVELGPILLEYLESKKADLVANPGERLLVKVGGESWELQLSGAGRRYHYLLLNEHAELRISTIKSPNVPAMSFKLLSHTLWERELEGAWGYAWGVADNEHTGELRVKGVLSRLDMAVDVTGVAFQAAEILDFVCRGRKKTKHRKVGGAESIDGCSSCGTEKGKTRTQDEDAQTLGEYLSGKALTGYSFGKSEISVRIYDKTREVREVSRDKFWLYPVWGAAGWVGTEQIWRVEVQWRREALKEMVSRDTGAELHLDRLSRLCIDPDGNTLHLDGLREALGSLWGYAVGGVTGHTPWIRWAKPSAKEKRRSRWKTRPEWQLVQRADWTATAPQELKRVEKRAAAYHRLIPQLVGIASTIAALRGPTRDGRAPSIGELEEDMLAYMAKMGMDWEVTVDDKRATYALWDLVGLEWDVPREHDVKRLKDGLVAAGKN